MNLKQISIQGVHSSQQILLQWNASETADYYNVIISVSPSETGPGSSSLVTPNTTVELFVPYNQEYKINLLPMMKFRNALKFDIFFLETILQTSTYYVIPQALAAGMW